MTSQHPPARQHHAIGLICGLFSLFWLAIGAAAQIVAPSAASSPSATDDDIIMMNPFEVHAGRDYGYQATTTLAGGRIQTELKDTPATVTILTKEFMDDLAFTNAVEFAEWTPNAEITYAENSYSDEYRSSSRGFGASFGSRNYFRSYSGGDSYNTERLEYSRGPNAMLFGDASVGGITTTWTKQALLNRRIANFQMKFDSNSSFRVNADYNFSPNKHFALRTNVLFSDSKTWREIEGTRLKGIHAAMTIALAKNTQFRVEGEYMDKEFNVGFYRILDQSSNWLKLTDAQKQTSAWTGPSTTATPGTGRISSQRLVWIESMPELGVLNMMNRGQSTGTGLSMVPEGRDAITGFPNMRSREFNPNAKDALFRYWTPTVSAYLDQRVGQNLFLQVAYNYARPKRIGDEIRWDDMYIDVNEYLPDPDNYTLNGVKNPYYGTPYADEETKRQRTQNELHEARAMAAWKFENSWTQQTFSALASYRTDEYRNARDAQVPRGIKSGTTYYSSNSSADRIFHRRYWNDLAGGDYGLATSIVGANGDILPVEWREYENTLQDTKLTSIQLANVGKYLKGRLNVMLGYRYDKYDRTDSTVASRHGATSPDNGKPINVILDPKKRQIAKEHSPSAGAVFWVIDGLGIAANYAESFNIPAYGNPDLYGRPIGPSTAKGVDIGFRFDFFNSKLTGSLLYYKNESEGGATSAGIDATNVTTPINNMWNVIDTTKTIPTAFRDLTSSKGHGYEAEIVYNPTSSWRMRFSLGIPYAETTDKWPYLKQYIADNRALWEASGSTIVSGTTTVQQTLDKLDMYVLANAENGLRLVQNSKWNASYFTSYRFAAGPLKGLTVGGGARYTATRFIGRTGAFNTTTMQNDYTNFWAKGCLIFNAMAKYEFKLSGRSATVQMNIDNLLNNDQINYRSVTTATVNSVASPYYQSYTWVEPLKISVSLSVKF